MIIRLIIIGLVFYIVSRILQIRKKIFTDVSKHSKNLKQKKNAQTLTSCPTCRVYFQKEQGVARSGLHYCSEKCARGPIH